MEQERIVSICYNEYSHSILFSAIYHGTVVIGNDTLMSSGAPGHFFASMDTSGSINWVKHGFPLLATEGDDYFYGVFHFISMGAIDTIPVTPGFWLAKFTIQGGLVWTKKLFNSNATVYNVDAWYDNIRVRSGKIFGFGSCSVDSFVTDTITVYANYLSNQYIIGCYDTSGSALWVEPTSGRNSNGPSDIEIDDQLNSYISGAFYTDGIFDQDTIICSGSDFFYAKYDSSGNFIWVDYGHTTGNQSWDIALDNENTGYVSLFIDDTVIICNDTILADVGGNTVIVRYDSSGSCLGKIKLDQNMTAFTIACAQNGLIMSGNFSSTLNLGSNTIISHGSWDTYIAKCDALTGTGEEEERRSNQLMIFANPNEGRCSITIPNEFKREKNLLLSIYDNKGIIIQEGSVEMNEEKVRVNLEAEAKGIYNVTLSNGKKSYAGKIVFE